MEDLNITYAHLLTNGSVLWVATPSPPMGAILWDRATTPPQGAMKPSCWTLKDLALRSGRGQQGYGCACCRSRRTSAWRWSLRLPKRHRG
jgi:hypothetical protein